jgi:hypothetical protein
MTDKPQVTTIRSSEGLRDVLFEELDALRNGTSTPQRSNAVCKISTELIKTVELEIEFYKNVTRGKGASEIPSTVLKLSGGKEDEKPNPNRRKEDEESKRKRKKSA